MYLAFGAPLRRLLVVVPLGLLPLVGGCCKVGFPKAWVEETRHIELSAADLDMLLAMTDNDSLNVTAADTDSGLIEIVAHLKASGRDEDDARAALEAVEIVTPVVDGDEVGAELAGQRVQVVRMDWHGKRGFGRSATVSLDITVPAELAVHAETENGQIAISGAQAACFAKSKNGRVQITGAGGPLQVKTDNGRIEIDGADGSLAVQSHNGAIDVLASARDVNLRTHNGRIKARLTSSGTLDSEIKTHNGAVRVELTAGVDAEVHCRTHNGSITVADDLGIKPSDRSRRQLRGRLGDGGGKLNVSTHNGSIRLEGHRDTQ